VGYGILTVLLKRGALPLNDAKQNFETIRGFFEQKLDDLGRDGVIGVAKFRDVYDDLMPTQQARLEQISGEQFSNLSQNGSIICLGMAYPKSAIDAIDAKLSNGTIDKNTWNIYAKEYDTLNKTLDAVAREIAQRFGGIVIPPVTGATVEKVEDYYGKTISHRVVAEHAGLGWRGKNELLVNESFSCALRFASVVTSLPLPGGKKLNKSCGDCTTCLDGCAILKTKNRLSNYRANCLEHITKLGLEKDVCGRCIKACYQRGKYAHEFRLR
jgi:epoxyqueuosine reductase